MISTSKTYNDEFEIMVISNIYDIKELQEIYASTNKNPEVAKLNLVEKIKSLSKEELLSIIESEIDEKMKKFKK